MTSSIQTGLQQASALQSQQIDQYTGNAAKKAPETQGLAIQAEQTKTTSLQSESPSTIVTLSSGEKEADLTYEAAVVGSSGGIRKPPP